MKRGILSRTSETKIKEMLFYDTFVVSFQSSACTYTHVKVTRKMCEAVIVN